MFVKIRQIGVINGEFLGDFAVEIGLSDGAATNEPMFDFGSDNVRERFGGAKMEAEDFGLAQDVVDQGGFLEAGRVVEGVTASQSALPFGWVGD